MKIITLLFLSIVTNGYVFGMEKAEAIEVLVSARRIEHKIDASGKDTRETTALVILCKDVDSLENVYKRAGIPGKLYAMIALAKFGRVEYLRHLEEMQNNTETITISTGCSVGEMRVSEYITEHIKTDGASNYLLGDVLRVK